MKPWMWRLGAGLGGLGAFAVAPSAPRIGTLRDLRERSWRNRKQPTLARHGWRRAALPPGYSLLIASGDYPAGHEVLRGIVRDARGPMLVIDMDGAMHASTAGWRVASGPVVRLAPFSGDQPWNPFAHAWTPDYLRGEKLTTLAALWYPERNDRERAAVTHTRNLFIALTGAIDDVLRHAGACVPPAPGDLWRLAVSAEDPEALRERLRALAATHGVRRVNANVLDACARLDDVTLQHVLRRLREPLALFADEACDTGTRGTGTIAPSSGTTYLHLPYAQRRQATPLIEALVAQWAACVGDHAEATIVIHALDLMPALPFLANTRDIRCIVTVRNLENLLLAYERDAHRVAKRFDLVAVHAPDSSKHAARDAGALSKFLKAHGSRESALRVDDLKGLRPDEQMLVGPTLEKPIRCRIATPRNHAPHPMPDIQGEIMAFPKPLAAVLAAALTRRAAPPPESQFTQAAVADATPPLDSLQQERPARSMSM